MVTEETPGQENRLQDPGDDVGQLKQDKEALGRELKTRDAAIIRLERVLAGKDGELIAKQQTLEAAEAKLAEIGKSLARTTESYGGLVVKSNPGVLADLITGLTVEEVDGSLQKALTLVGRVRQELEAEASRTRIPAGAPQRAGQDLSGLSPREKIQYAIGGS